MNKITFTLPKNQYDLLIKYTDFSELNYVLFNDDKLEVTIDKNELSLFQDLVIEASTTYGLDSDGEITEFGRKLEAVYDNIYSQIH